MMKFFKYRDSSWVSHDLMSGPIIAEFLYLGKASSILRNLVASLPSDAPSMRDPIVLISVQVIIHLFEIFVIN